MFFSQHLDSAQSLRRTKLKLPLRPHLPNPSGNGKAAVRIEGFIKKVIDAGKDRHAAQLFGKRQIGRAVAIKAGHSSPGIFDAEAVVSFSGKAHGKGFFCPIRVGNFN